MLLEDFKATSKLLNSTYFKIKGHYTLKPLSFKHLKYTGENTCACICLHHTYMCNDIIHTSHTPLHHPLLLYYTCIPQLLSTSVSLASSSSEGPSRGMPFTTELAGASTPHSTSSPLPCYQVIDNEGKVIDPNQDPQVRTGREGERERDHSTFLDCFPCLRLIFPSICY